MIAPYGSWRSPISAGLVASAGLRLDALQADGGELYWIEGRPAEGGRSVLVRAGADVTPSGFNVRTRVHEYGGGAYVVHAGVVYFSNFADQRLYRQRHGFDPEPITPDDSARYADSRVTPDGQLLICVRERDRPASSSLPTAELAAAAPHSGADMLASPELSGATPARLQPVNEIVVVPTDGSRPPRAIASGHDFYASPRISPDGQQLAWLSWDHPNMPWDGTELWVAGLDGTNARRVAGGREESIFQPEWSPAGVLHWVSDRSGWWNISSTPRIAAEFGQPQWVFGQSTYTFLPDGRIAAIYSRDGFDHLALLEHGAWRTLDVPFSAFEPHQLTMCGERLAFIAASPTEPAAVVAYDPSSNHAEILKRSFTTPGSRGLDPGFVSQPRAIAFPTAGGQVAHAIFYPPANRDYQAPEGERPPLIVMSHGGPTSQTLARLSPAIQFWTSRGFAAVDVNYGGSTGYGRAYRERLKGQWGIVDTQDCIAAARYLAEQGEVDGQRLAIRGGSAGGYTTLCALVFHHDFSAGASYYGVAELESLATDTHKFESRYLDSLIGPYPERRDLYRARSPIHFADKISCPVILFQGLDDRVVPPAQARIFVDALESKRLPYAYLAFEGEQHGFRQAGTIQRTLEAELYFYSRVFGFALADPVEPVAIQNL